MCSDIKNNIKTVQRPTHKFFGVALGLCVLALSALSQGAAPVSVERVQQAMLKATRFMVEDISYKGGYVWSYSADKTRRWGEMEATPTMVWVQPPGTATMGHVFLDAYHATGNEYYYRAAEQTANALIWGQHTSGGWNYMFDFAGEASLKQWYNTIGKNGWRLEEFHHYYGNATFDDGGTAEASKFLLRLYIEKLDPKYKPALERAIDFVLNAQYPIGGWPQRYPLKYEYSSHGNADYTSYITFNDDVAMGNIEFLLMCYQALGASKVVDPIIRAMNSLLVTQMGPPQQGWALQYSLDLKPAAARTYEPKALSTQATVSSIQQLMVFYTLTGESKFLAPIPAALSWLESLKLPPSMHGEDGRNYPTFVELGTNKPIFAHRRGSNVVNGEYYVDYDHKHTLLHFRGHRHLPLKELREKYKSLLAIPVEQLLKNSPLMGVSSRELPKFFTLKPINISDLNSRDYEPKKANSAEALRYVLASQAESGAWLTPLSYTTNPYIGSGPKEITPGDFRFLMVGDKWDTSPYRAQAPIEGISVGTYIKNMGVLIKAIAGDVD